MTNPMIRIHNLETDEIIDREMTSAEYAVYEADQLEAKQLETKMESDKTSAQAKLEEMGLSVDDLKALGL
jgi:hypothetical protein